MLCSAVIVEWLLLKLCYVLMYCMLFVMYGIRLCTSVLAITESEMGLYEVTMFMSLLGFGRGIMFANFHVCGMMLLFNAMLYMLVRYVSPRGLMCSKCPMIHLS